MYKLFFYKPNSGFTLIELMTTIVIVGVLGTAAFSSYQQYEAKARSIELYNMVAAIERNQQMYHTEYGTFLFLKNSTSVTAREAMRLGNDWVADGGESVQMQNNWAQVGKYVTAVGSRTRIYMVTNMGKFQRNGTAASWVTTWSRGPISQPLFRAYDEFASTITSGGHNFVCSDGTDTHTVEYYPTDFGAIQNPGRAYDWSLTSALARFGKRELQCQNVARLLTYDSRTGEYKRAGFLTFE